MAKRRTMVKRRTRTTTVPTSRARQVPRRGGRAHGRGTLSDDAMESMRATLATLRGQLGYANAAVDERPDTPVSLKGEPTADDVKREPSPEGDDDGPAKKSQGRIAGRRLVDR